MKFQHLVYSTLLMLNFSCGTMNIGGFSKSSTTEKIVIGNIGDGKEFILQNKFKNSAFPSYKQPVKVSVSEIFFNNRSYQLFEKAKGFQSSNININYTDSISDKPKYLKLTLADKVGVINALNNDENHSVKTYLSHKKDVVLVSGVSIAFNKEDIKSIEDADVVFFIEKNYKNYVLQLYNSGKIAKELSFNQGVVFQYETLNCCWQKNTRQELNIVDLVTGFSDCPRETFRSIKRAQKKNTYYKF
ncbi:hypothetical protein [Aestuariibaculum sediminum]|uniref:Uncharacterized protein n=1 Tax=Aestuariibaculum sediminum TaxID=2770637 RepID=A0A8J6U9A8_9FLAO|nr:hypothetical protein [Aestuariibaculum sediminum]MBD0833790.1 hypothetical protein [Aestuariibaculum sediminum]